MLYSVQLLNEKNIKLTLDLHYTTIKGKYSQFIWDQQCFNGAKDGEDKKGIYKIHNKYGNGWNDNVSHQFGNYDYLMIKNIL